MTLDSKKNHQITHVRCLFLLVFFHMFRIQRIQVVAVFNIPFGVENSDLR